MCRPRLPKSYAYLTNGTVRPFGPGAGRQTDARLLIPDRGARPNPISATAFTSADADADMTTVDRPTLTRTMPRSNGLRPEAGRQPGRLVQKPSSPPLPVSSSPPKANVH